MRGQAVRRGALSTAPPKPMCVVDLGTRKLPGIAEIQPVLGIFVLPAVADGLAEQAVVVADAIAVGGDRQRRHALHETGGEAAEAAIAQRCVGLDVAQLVEIDVEAGERRAHRLDQAEIAQANRPAAGRSGIPARGNRPGGGCRGNCARTEVIQLSTMRSRAASATAMNQSRSLAALRSLPTRIVQLFQHGLAQLGDLGRASVCGFVRLRFLGGGQGRGDFVHADGFLGLASAQLRQVGSGRRDRGGPATASAATIAR